jgi:hypothetical protein
MMMNAWLQTTRSGARFREVSAVNLYARSDREIAGGGIAFGGGYKQEIGIHFDPGPQVFKQHDSSFLSIDDYG